MCYLRASVLAVFDDSLEAERDRSAARHEQAAIAGVVRDGFAREQRIREVANALLDVPKAQWRSLDDWLTRNIFGSSASPIVSRPRDRRGSWIGAEKEALNLARREIEKARLALLSSLSVDALDAEGTCTGFPEGADLAARLGANYFGLVAEVQAALAKVEKANTLLLAEPELETVYESPNDELTNDLDAFTELAPSDGRRPAQRAFPELMRFWTDDVRRSQNDKEQFLTFARAVLSAKAATMTDNPAEWTAGLEQAFRQR